MAIKIKLKEERVHNGDSAYFVGWQELEKYLELARRGIIKSIDSQRFWLEEDTEKQLDLSAPIH